MTIVSLFYTTIGSSAQLGRVFIEETNINFGPSNYSINQSLWMLLLARITVVHSHPGMTHETTRNFHIGSIASI